MWALHHKGMMARLHPTSKRIFKDILHGLCDEEGVPYYGLLGTPTESLCTNLPAQREAEQHSRCYRTGCQLVI